MNTERKALLEDSRQRWDKFERKVFKSVMQRKYAEWVASLNQVTRNTLTETTRTFVAAECDEESLDARTLNQLLELRGDFVVYAWDGDEKHNSEEYFELEDFFMEQLRK